MAQSSDLRKRPQPFELKVDCRSDHGSLSVLPTDRIRTLLFDPGASQSHNRQMPHRITLSRMAAAGLVLMLVIPGPSGAGVDQSERQQTEHDSSSEQNAKELSSQSPGSVETKAPDPSPSDCGMLETAAGRYGLPAGFFTRLIRQESDFDPKAISRAGAMGIAQFMPGTARWRGVANPFEPKQALEESARWLTELRAAFGNIGLAAAAYNAGPQRVKDWIAGRANLPRETLAYVRIITGRSADDWLHGGEKDSDDFNGPIGPCTAHLKLPSIKMEANRDVERAQPAGWGLQLTGDGSEVKARAEYALLQGRFSSVLGGRTPTIIKKPIGGRTPSAWYFVTISAPSRERATQLCSKLRSAGGSCLVTPNRGSATDREPAPG
jgi:hypothetical protein